MSLLIQPCRTVATIITSTSQRGPIEDSHQPKVVPLESGGARTRTQVCLGSKLRLLPQGVIQPWVGGQPDGLQGPSTTAVRPRSPLEFLKHLHGCVSLSVLPAVCEVGRAGTNMLFVYEGQGLETLRKLSKVAPSQHQMWDWNPSVGFSSSPKSCQAPRFYVSHD